MSGRYRCEHVRPGVVNMAEAARRHSGRPVYALLGGFHMGGASVDEINRVVRDLRQISVRQAHFHWPTGTPSFRGQTPRDKRPSTTGVKRLRIPCKR